MVDLLEISQAGKNKAKRHPKCKGTYDAYNGEYDCDYGSMLDCDQCKYGFGRKDPKAKCNHES